MHQEKYISGTEGRIYFRGLDRLKNFLDEGELTSLYYDTLEEYLSANTALVDSTHSLVRKGSARVPWVYHLLVERLRRRLTLSVELQAVASQPAGAARATLGLGELAALAQSWKK